MPTKQRPTFLPQKDATFISLLECLSVSRPPEGPQWLWEIKLDGHRALLRRPIETACPIGQ
jgi:ATP-dependent DNA ligase